MGAGSMPCARKDIAHRRVGDVVLEIGQSALDAVVAPSRVFAGELQHEFGHFLGNGWSANGLLFTLVAIVPLLGYQRPVPTQDPIRGEQRGELGQPLASQDFPFDRQAAPLIVGQHNPLGTVRFPEHPVLGEQIINHLLLLPVHPAGHARHQHVHRFQNKAHAAPLEVSKATTSAAELRLSMAEKNPGKHAVFRAAEFFDHTGWFAKLDALRKKLDPKFVKKYDLLAVYE